MARALVRLNSAGVRVLLQSQAIRAELDRRAQRIEARAKDTAPADSGVHRDSIHREHATYRTRAVVRVVADSDHSLWVEARTGNLARSLDAARGN